MLLCTIVLVDVIKAVVEIKKAMSKRPAPDGAAKKKNTVSLELRMKGNPQETHRAEFYVIYNHSEMDPLPTAIFVVASSTSSHLEAALEEISRQLSAPPNNGKIKSSSSLSSS